MIAWLRLDAAGMRGAIERCETQGDADRLADILTYWAHYTGASASVVDVLRARLVQRSAELRAVPAPLVLTGCGEYAEAEYDAGEGRGVVVVVVACALLMAFGLAYALLVLVF